MLRITKVEENSETITMKLEGKLASEWVPLLEQECRNCLRDKRRVLLDLSEVTFVDKRGVEMLSKASKKKIQILDCTALIRDLLKGGKRND